MPNYTVKHTIKPKKGVRIFQSFRRQATRDDTIPENAHMPRLLQFRDPLSFHRLDVTPLCLVAVKALCLCS